MPKPVKKPRERRWGKPHGVIEKTARKDWLTGREVLEACWFKRPRGDLKYAALKRTRHSVQSREPLVGETMYIHTHSAPSGTPLEALPSGNDLHRAWTDFIYSDIRSWVISRVYKRGEIGRTIIKVKKGATENQEVIERNERLVEQYVSLVEKLGELLLKRRRRHEVAEVKKKIWDALRRLESEGVISIRFVPMPGYRFDKEKGDFVKTQTVWSRLKNRIKALKPF